MKIIIEKLKSQSEDEINSYAASSWEDYVSITKLNYIGSYFLTPKNNDDYWYDSTIIYMVYKVTVHEDYEDWDDTFSYYCFVKFYDPIILSDGTYSIDISNYDTCKGYNTDSNNFSREIEYDKDPKWSWLGTTTLTYYGYEDLDSLFNKCVTANVDTYNYESTVEDAETNEAEETTEAAETTGATETTEAAEEAAENTDETEDTE